MIASAAELDERNRELEQALKAKEAALRELQHRAKNSLQLVISLLKLQSGRIHDPDARTAYDLTLQRIEALAIAYRHLHESGSETQVEFGHYLSDLVMSTSAHAPAGGPPVAIEVQAEEIIGNLSVAVPLGLIVNEILSNCMRHAFPERGKVRILLARLDDRTAELVVADNGRGLPAGFDADADAGLLLADALAAQINGTLGVETSGSGTTMRLTFPL